MRKNRNTFITGKNVVLIPYEDRHVPKYHSWMKSEELQKLTASDPLSLDEEYAMQKSWRFDENKCTFIILDKEKYEQTKNEIDAMIGDTNLFFSNEENHLCAEAEIMIAEEWARGRKCGWEAMLHMLLYGVKYLDVKEFIVKISEDNHVSRKMFQNMGFVETSQSFVFQEITSSKIVDDTWIQWLENSLSPYEIKTGDNDDI